MKTAIANINYETWFYPSENMIEIKYPLLFPAKELPPIVYRETKYFPTVKIRTTQEQVIRRKRIGARLNYRSMNTGLYVFYLPKDNFKNYN